MFELRKKFRFEAAHRLPFHDGKCSRLHGHSWVVTIIIRGNHLIEDGPKKGMVMDYGEISKAVEEIINRLDHQSLNEFLSNPTSENVAKYIFSDLWEKITMLVAVEIEETCTCACRYEPEG